MKNFKVTLEITRNSPRSSITKDFFVNVDLNEEKEMRKEAANIAKYAWAIEYINRDCKVGNFSNCSQCLPFLKGIRIKVTKVISA